MCICCLNNYLFILVVLNAGDASVYVGTLLLIYVTMSIFLLANFEFTTCRAGTGSTT